MQKVVIRYVRKHMHYNKEGMLKVNHYEEETIKTFDIPRAIHQRRQRFFSLLQMKLQLENLKYHVDVYYSFYEDKPISLEQLKKRQQAAIKAQITKIENAMQEYRKEQEAKLFWEKENDPIWQKAIAKLKRQMKKMEAL